MWFGNLATVVRIAGMLFSNTVYVVCRSQRQLYTTVYYPESHPFARVHAHVCVYMYM